MTIAANGLIDSVGAHHPLSGVRVIEFANFISGPYAGMLLANLGADVIKVELPGLGDPFRRWDRDPIKAPSFVAYNVGKRSLTIDVRIKGGSEIVLKLLESADVFLQNFRLGYLQKLGLGYEKVAKINPRLVYCQISGFGDLGPDREGPAFDAVGQARSGLWSQLSGEDQDWRAVGPPISDQLAGMFAAQGILAALFARHQTGKGCLVSTDMVSASFAFVASSVAEFSITGNVRGPYDRSHGSQSYGFVGSDGKPFGVQLSNAPKFWDGILEVTGRTDLKDRIHLSEHAGRVDHYEEILTELRQAFSEKPRHFWLDRLSKADVPVGAINNVAEALDDPQIIANGTMMNIRLGNEDVRLVSSPLRLSDAEHSYVGVQDQRKLAQLGEDTEELLKECGFSSKAILELQSRGAV